MADITKKEYGTLFSLLIVLGIIAVVMIILVLTGVFNNRSDNPEENLVPDGAFYHTRIAGYRGNVDALYNQIKVGVRDKGAITAIEYNVDKDTNSGLRTSITVFDLLDPSKFHSFDNKASPQLVHKTALPVPTDGYRGTSELQIAAAMHDDSSYNNTNAYSGHVEIYNIDGTKELQKIERKNSRPWDIGYDLVNDTMYVLWLELGHCHVIGYTYSGGEWVEKDNRTFALGNIKPVHLLVTRYTMYVADGTTGKIHIMKRDGKTYSKTPQVLEVTGASSLPILAESPDGLWLAIGNITADSNKGKVWYYKRTKTSDDFPKIANSTQQEGTGQRLGHDLAFQYADRLIATRLVTNGGAVVPPTIYNATTKSVIEFPVVQLAYNTGTVNRFFDEEHKEFHFYVMEDRALASENGEMIMHHFWARSKK